MAIYLEAEHTEALEAIHTVLEQEGGKFQDQQETTRGVNQTWNFQGQDTGISIMFNGSHIFFKLPLIVSRPVVPLNSDLTGIREININYPFRVLTPEIRTNLNEIGTRPISSEEIRSSDTDIFPPIGFFEEMPAEECLFNIMQHLQRPSEQHSICIAAVDREVLSPEQLPHHLWQDQEGHYCLVDEAKPMPLLPFDFHQLPYGLRLLFDFHSHPDTVMGTERTTQLFSGLPLSLHTRLEFTSNPPPENAINHDLTAMIEPPNLEDGLFTIEWKSEKTPINQGINIHLPQLMTFYRAFSKNNFLR